MSETVTITQEEYDSPPSKMTSADYPEGYWERAEGSNYTKYGDEIAWPVIWEVLRPHISGPVREIACAKGYFVRHGYFAGYDVKGIDISQYAIDNAAPGVSAVIEQANATELPWPDDEAQILCAFEFMEHVYEDELDTVLDEMERVTYNGSIIVLKIGLAGMDDHCEDDHTHYTQKTRDWWEDRLAVRNWTRFHELEDALDKRVADVQPTWAGRFFCYVR